MRIVLDAMGSDTYPDPEIKAAAEAAVRFNEKALRPMGRTAKGVRGIRLREND